MQIAAVSQEEWLPATLDPFGEMRSLGADGRVLAMARQHDGVGREGEEFGVDRVDNRGEVAPLKSRIAGATGKQSVAREQQRRALDMERNRSLCVPRIVDCAQSQTAYLDHLGVVDEYVVSNVFQAGGVERSDGNFVPSLAHSRYRLDVIPVAMGF